MSLDFGEIERTTVQNPNGGLGTFSPQFMNLGVSYAKKFTDRISGGVTLRLISESAADIAANGFSLIQVFIMKLDHEIKQNLELHLRILEQECHLMGTEMILH